MLLHPTALHNLSSSPFRRGKEDFFFPRRTWTWCFQSIRSCGWSVGLGEVYPAGPALHPGPVVRAPQPMAEETRGHRKGLSHTAPPCTRQAIEEMLLSTFFETGKWVIKVSKPWKNCPVVASRSPWCCSAHPHLYSISSPPWQGMVAIKCDNKYLGLSFVFL